MKKKLEAENLATSFKAGGAFSPGVTKSLALKMNAMVGLFLGWNIEESMKNFAVSSIEKVP
jgi:hypothetical protein